MDNNEYKALAGRLISLLNDLNILVNGSLMEYIFDRQQLSSLSSRSVPWFKHCFEREWSDDQLLSAGLSQLVFAPSVAVLPLPSSHALLSIAKCLGGREFRTSTISQFRDRVEDVLSKSVSQAVVFILVEANSHWARL